MKAACCREYSDFATPNGFESYICICTLHRPMLLTILFRLEILHHLYRFISMFLTKAAC